MSIFEVIGKYVVAKKIYDKLTGAEEKAKFEEWYKEQQRQDELREELVETKMRLHQLQQEIDAKNNYGLYPDE